MNVPKVEIVAIRQEDGQVGWCDVRFTVNGKECFAICPCDGDIADPQEFDHMEGYVQVLLNQFVNEFKAAFQAYVSESGIRLETEQQAV
jgi:hypothetical protein